MTDQSETQTSKSADLLKEGRRHFICREYPQAVEKLSLACELLAEEFGDGNVNLADSFYSYGEALLEMARMEGPVLGNALKGAEVIDDAEEVEPETEKDDRIENESLTDEAKEEISNNVIDALCEAPVVEKEETEKPQAMETEEKKEEDSGEEKESEAKPVVTETAEEEADKEEKPEEKSDKGDEKEEEEEEVKQKDGEGEEKETEDDDKEEEEEGEDDGDGDGEEAIGEEEKAEEEVGNLQLAWEIIEVARTMYEKKAAEETEAADKSRLRVADCHRKLAEVMLERDEWQKASEELQKCLDIELSILKTPNRRIAETHFEMGMAFDHAKSYDESAAEFQKCVNCLQEYQEVLKNKTEKSEEEEKEVSELDDVIKDVRGRLMEVKEQKKAAFLAAETNGAGSSSGVTSNGFGAHNASSNGFGVSSTSNGLPETKADNTSGSGEKETQDISHLVRKRPKDSESADSPLKKVRVEAEKTSPVKAPSAEGDVEVS